MATPNETSFESLDESSRFTIPKSQWRRVLLIAVVLPILLTIVNGKISGQLAVGVSTTAVVVVFCAYIAEMTVVAVAAGAGIRQTWLAWTLLAWLLLMINMHLVVAAVGGPNSWSGERDLPVVAFAAAQLGFLAVWTAIGGEKVYLRLPITTVAACVVLFFWHHCAEALRHPTWTTILIIEVASTVLLSITLRLARFRLHRLGDTPPDSTTRHIQFGLRHVLILITALAILLGVAKAAQMLTLPFLLDVIRSLKLWRLGIACPSAMLVVLAFWAALGKGSALLRFALIAFGCVAVGFGTAAWSAYMLNTAVPGGRVDWDLWQQMKLWEIGYWWIAWYCLSAGLLSACLLFFRTRGYRIVRTSRRQTSA